MYLDGMTNYVYNPLSVDIEIESLPGDIITITNHSHFEYYIFPETRTFQRRFNRKVIEMAKIQYRLQREQRAEIDRNVFFDENGYYTDEGSDAPLDAWENEKHVTKSMVDMSIPELCKAISYLNKGARAFEQQHKIVSLRRVLREKRNAISV